MPISRFSVPELHCPGCARIVRDALEGSSGVRSVETDLSARLVTVDYMGGGGMREGIGQRIREAGFACSCEDDGETASGRHPLPVIEGAGAVPTPSRASWYALLATGLAVFALGGYAGYELYPRFDLPGVEGAGLLVLAVGAGIASFFSPCAFPLLVTLLARETGARAGPTAGSLAKGLRFATALSLGAAAFLLLAGVAIALGGGALFTGVTFTSGAGKSIRGIVGGLLIALGLVQLGALPNPLDAMEGVSRPLLRKQAEMRRSKPGAGFALFGFGYLLAGFG